MNAINRSDVEACRNGDCTSDCRICDFERRRDEMEAQS